MPKGIRSIEEIEEHVAYHSGYALSGVNFSKRDDGWLCIVKVRSKKEGDLVTFIHAHSPGACLELLSDALTTTSFNLRWRKDKWKGS